MNANVLLESLIVQTQEIKSLGKKLKLVNIENLEWRESTTAWNVLECVQHMNLYGDYYLETIQRAIQNTDHKMQEDFSSGWLGNYFAQSMLPKQKLNKIKTFKDKDPIGTQLTIEVIDTFVNQQAELIDLLNQAKAVNIQKTKVTISITKWIKLRLGDTFRFFINHNLRHLNQIDRILSSTIIQTPPNILFSLKSFSLL